MRVNERIRSFLGLNNLLDPASADYREGMAYSCDDARINKKGLWTGVPATSGAVSTTSAISGGDGQRQMTKDGVSTLITGIDCATEGQNGCIYYIDSVLKKKTGSTASTVAQADVAAPTLSAAAVSTAATTLGRIQTGLYYYIITDYNDTIKRESLPSAAREVDYDTATDKSVTLTASALVSGCTRRVYRSKGTNVTNEYYNAPNIFYYIGDISSGTSYSDYRGDDELLVEYEGRGTVMTDPDFIVSYNDRMLYFRDNILWWSSSGRPEEVAQKYDIVFYSGGYTQTMPSYPKLTNGYGETKKEISELAGQTVTGAIEKDGKLWIFTEALCGYLAEAYGGEGYVFKVFRRGIGALNQFVLQSCEHGIFGFDGQGMWLLDNSNRIKRLTDNRVDLSSFYSGSFLGIWVANLNEYWMCNGTTVIPYQADREIFVGPYTLAITAGCSWYDDTGAWGLTGASKISEGIAGITLIFYLGQSSPTTIKQQITVEAVQAGNSSLTVKVTPLPRRSITGISPVPTEISSGAISETAVRATAVTTGRMIKAEITLVSSLDGGISTINYRYDPIGWSVENGR
uniref:Uncharacterized protein n=2 Tax=viral metagenome TaxID=1070528 RepID=A0A6H1ZPG9_9ZZZZ